MQIWRLIIIAALSKGESSFTVNDTVSTLIQLVAFHVRLIECIYAIVFVHAFKDTVIIIVLICKQVPYLTVRSVLLIAHKCLELAIVGDFGSVALVLLRLVCFYF